MLARTKRRFGHLLYLWMFGLPIAPSPLTVAAEQETNSSNPSLARELAPEKEQISVTGRVLGPNGSPIAGAKIYVSKPFFGEWTQVGISDDEGNAQFAIEAMDGFREEQESAPVRFAAVSEGRGFNWLDVKWSDLVESKNPEFRLLEDIPIEGRILNSEGEPVQDVAVYLNAICQPKHGNLEEYLRTASKENPGDIRSWGDDLWSGSLPGRDVLRSDEEGRFRLEGVGAQRLVEFSLKGEGVHNWWFIIATRQPPVGDEKAGAVHLAEPPNNSHYYASFTHISPPSRMLRGVVRDKETGQPIPDVHVKADFASSVESRTNQAGEFSIVGARKQPYYKVEAIPRGTGYFNREMNVRDEPGVGPLDIEIKLIRGITLRGHVTDKTTGLPVKGTVEYYPLFPNKHVERFTDTGPTPLPASTCKIREDGSYELQVLPGPGAVGVLNFEPQYALPPPFDMQQVERLLDGVHVEGNSSQVLATAAGGQARGLIGRTRFRSLSLIKPEEDTEMLAVDVHLTAGRDIYGVVADPHGLVERELLVSGMFSSGRGFGKTVAKNGRFRVRALTPEESRLVIFYDPQNQLGTTLNVKGDTDGELNVQLAACGSIQGQLVDKNRKPIANVALELTQTPAFRVSGGEHTWLRSRTDEEGRFQIDGLVPGVKYFAEALALSDRTLFEAKVESKQNRDLGLIEVERPADE